MVPIEAHQGMPGRSRGSDAAVCRYTLVESPLGPVLAAANDQGLTRINFQTGDAPLDIPRDWERDDGALCDAAEQLRAYFAGRLHAFQLPLAPDGTPFQQQVWAELRTIPYGETRSYVQVAHKLGMRSGARTVGTAAARNPLLIVVPCHRVIGSTGDLTGFRGGVRLKEFLLLLERCNGPRAGQP